MKNALILHGTDFDKNQKQRFGNWFPWLKSKLESRGYEVLLPELPEAWHPDLNRYWKFLQGFNFNEETIIVGHSSGGAMIFGLLHKLPPNQKIACAISVAGFYKDEGWNCEGLFSEQYDWKKVQSQANKIVLIWSPTDSYISQEQTDYLANHLAIKSTILPNRGHFNLESGLANKKLPELLPIIFSPPPEGINFFA